MKLYVKNMACESCKVVVRSELKKLGLAPTKVELGEAEIEKTPTGEQLQKLNKNLRKAGLEVLEKKQGILVEKIKHAIVAHTFDGSSGKKAPLSSYLAKKLDYSYAYLASFFSSMEATTIEQYAIALKIERAKELLMFEEHTLTQIAKMLGYSSISHLSGQFKKVTGLSPSHFKKLRQKRRLVIQDI